MSDSKFLRGMFILTVGTFLTKFLGILFVIPFNILVDKQGIALYQYGYVQYMAFLSIANGGIPLAVSKYVSKYNKLGQYKTSKKIFNFGLVLLTVTGVIAFIVLFLSAPIFARQIVLEGAQGNSLEDIIFVIRMTAVALLIVPLQSVIRGYFQGFQQMMPTSVSQFIEQVARIGFALIMVFVVLRVQQGETVSAIGWATFGATVGAIGGLMVLLWYWYKSRDYFRSLELSDPNTVTISTKEMLKEILLSSIPFILVGMTDPMYQQIDVLTFNRTMAQIDMAGQAETIFAILTMNVRQLSMIPVTIATAFSISLVPAITTLFVAGDRVNLRRQISQVYQIILFITIPAVVGMSILSYPLYVAFFGSSSNAGGSLLAWASFNGIFFSLLAINAAILQGINQQKHVIVGMILGLIAKASLNVPFITAFQGVGPILTHMIGFAISIAYFLWVIKKETRLRLSLVIRRTALVSIFTVAMSVAVLLVKFIVGMFVSYETGRLGAVIILLPTVIIGMGLYFALGIKSGLLERIFGAEFMEKITRKFFRRGQRRAN